MLIFVVFADFFLFKKYLTVGCIYIFIIIMYISYYFIISLIIITIIYRNANKLWCLFVVSATMCPEVFSFVH